MTPIPDRLPVALTIAGSDSSGGAGIQADLKSFSALGVYGASVITALTAQNTTGVRAVHVPPADFVVAQLEAVFDDLNVRGVKTGMLATAEIVTEVARFLGARCMSPIIVDPVMVATSSDRLLAPEAERAVRDVLLPVAALVTPNLHEAAVLLGSDVASSEAEMIRQGQAILALGPGGVLMKGGHMAGTTEALDLLVTAAGVERFSAPRIETRNTHGTGCTLSAAIAAGCANGLPLGQAVASAKSYLSEALQAGSGLVIGAGHGPVNHLVRFGRGR
ncbi:MAG: bifunctional hydroxymethylpyrimidine kinase/phosphomethylpyrimidine kinase [Pseudomonadota bacterium]|jgi:hydroxymethylpyrimidine/phosphomethylpyrimidine kinase